MRSQLTKGFFAPGLNTYVKLFTCKHLLGHFLKPMLRNVAENIKICLNSERNVHFEHLIAT